VDSLWQHQGVEGGALIDRVLVIGFQLIEGNNVEDGEEDEEGVDDKRHDVGKRSEGEGHPEPSELSMSETKETVNVREHASQFRRPRLGLAALAVGKGDTRAPSSCHNIWSQSETNLSRQDFEVL